MGAVTAPHGKELTAKERQQWGREAQKIETRVKSSIAKGRAAMWELAEALHDFEQSQGWLALGVDTRAEWLADPEITITLRTYQRMVRTWKELHVIRKFDMEQLQELDLSKVDIVLPAIEQGDVSIRKALGDAKALGARDLRIEYYGEQSKDSKAGEAPQNGAGGDEIIDGEGNPVTAASSPEAGAEQPVRADQPVESDQGGEVVQAEAQPDEPATATVTVSHFPAEDEWQQIVERAKSRRQALPKYIEKMTEWTRQPDTTGKEREHWVTSMETVTQEVPAAQNASVGVEVPWPPITQEGEATAVVEGLDTAQLDAMLAEVESCLQSGQAHPRIDRQTLAVIAAPWLAPPDGVKRQQGSGRLTVMAFDGSLLIGFGEDLNAVEAVAFVTGAVMGEEPAEQ